MTSAVAEMLCNNSTLIVSLANNTSEFILSQLTNNSTVSIGINNIIPSNPKEILSISTLSGIIVGFILSQGTDYFKSRRESIQKDKEILERLQNDWQTNNDIYKLNSANFFGGFLSPEDIKLMEEKPEEAEKRIKDLEAYDGSLTAFKTSFWDLISLNLPNKMIEGDTLDNIRQIAVITENVNDNIQNRDTFINNSKVFPVLDANEKIKAYNVRLIQDMNSLNEFMSKFQPLYTYENLKSKK